MRALAEHILDEIIRRLTIEFQPEEIRWFGSHAWSHPDDGCDIDSRVRA